MNTALHLLGYKAESFFVTDESQGQTRPEVLSTIVISIILFLVFGIIFCYGAAKLSYNYNMSIGNGGTAYLWSIVCFFFANIYYPYYALILSPVSADVAVTGAGATMTGGKRSKSK